MPTHPTLPGVSALAEAAGRLTLKYFNNASYSMDEKSDRKGIVTQADLESETHIRDWIHGQFPDHLILAEESGWSKSLPTDANRTPLWLVDPLDGTTNFSKSNPYYCVSIGFGYCTGKRVEMQLGVIHHPALGLTYTAELGKGAYKSGKRLSAPSAQDFRLGTYATGFGPVDGARLRQVVEMIYRVQSACTTTAVRMNGAAALDLAHTASGMFQGFWETSLNPWDTAAGSLIASEAGYKLTNLAGQPFEVLRDPDVVCAPTTLHAEFLRLLSSQTPAAKSE